MVNSSVLRKVQASTNGEFRNCQVSPASLCLMHDIVARREE